ncbi:hypothetical protein N8952_01685, partial [Candidatus Pelagibacter ubique]|nr:hypothetical protein [Candidatus Pelagibacter ubique]
NFMNRFKFNQIYKKDLVLMKYINIFSICILITIFPAYLIFNYFVFIKFSEYDLILVALVFSFLLIFSRKVFLFFFFFSINNMPMKQLKFSLLMFLGNFILNVLLFDYIGLYGIVFATSTTYFISAIYISYFLKKYKKVLNFV